MQNSRMVRDVVAREYVGVSESDTVAETAALMVDEGTDCAVVLRGSEPVGLLTDRDVLALVSRGEDPDETAVSEVMGPPATSVAADEHLHAAVQEMAGGDVRHLLVTEGSDLVGVLDAQDVVTATSRLLTAPDVNAGPNDAIRVDAAGNSQEGSGPPPEPDVAEAEYSTQSVCEVCGALTRDLRDFNGQLICEDCLDV